MNIRDVMTPDPQTVSPQDSIQNAARIMRDQDTGVPRFRLRDIQLRGTLEPEKAIEIEGSETDKWTDGKEYPVARVDVSSASHPYYTGQEKVMDTAGRVERFKAKMAKAGKAKS